MSHPPYANPPVHEVVLSLIFHDKLDAEELDQLPEIVGQRFPPPQRVEQTQTEVAVDHAGEPAVTTRRKFEGWVFKSTDSTQLLRTLESQVSYHAVRPGRWPDGPYPGWSVVSKSWFDVLKLLASAYEQNSIRRAGLRYLNRIAVPEDRELTDWFALTFRGPSLLSNPFAFNLAHTWSDIQGAPGFSAQIRMATIKIEHQAIAKDNRGILLDIDVFNIYPKDAPRYGELETWFESAHAIENQIFENSITDQFRSRLD